MQQIPKQGDAGSQNTYRNFVNAYLGTGDNTGIIKPSKPHDTIIRLNADAVNGHFYFIVDVLGGTIVLCQGIDRWLGYGCENFAIKKYIEIIHPAHAANVNLPSPALQTKRVRQPCRLFFQG